LQELPLARIAVNPKYQLSFHRPLGPLLASIQEIGQVTPVLCRGGKSPELFSGFMRIAALKNLKRKSALAMVVSPQDCSGLDAFRIAFFENASGRGLNLIEQSMAVNALKGFGLDAKKIAQLFFLKTGLPGGFAAVESLAALAGLEEEWKKFLVEKQTGLRLASELARISAQDRGSIKFLPALRATASQFREALEMSLEISRRERTGFAEVMKMVGAAAILSRRLPGSRKLELLLDALRQLRHPALSRLQTRHRKLCAELHIPAQARLDPADYFEGPEYLLQLKVDQSTAAQGIFSRLKSAASSEQWQKLFQLDDED